MNDYNKRCPCCGGYAIMFLVFTTGGAELRLVCLNQKEIGCPL